MSSSRKLRVVAVYRLGANPKGRSWRNQEHVRRARLGLLVRSFQEWPKRCACGRAWTESDWSTLRHVGVLDLGGDRLDLRQCTCESTIAVPISAEAP